MVQIICYIKKIIPRRISTGNRSQISGVVSSKPRNVIRSSTPGITGLVQRSPVRYLLICFAVGVPFLALPPNHAANNTTPQKHIQYPPNLTFVPPYSFDSSVIVGLNPDERIENPPSDNPNDSPTEVSEPNSFSLILTFLALCCLIIFRKKIINFLK